jgi:hypothetical protein
MIIPSKKYLAAMLVLVFSVVFLVSYFLISLTPFAFYRERQHSYPPLGGSSNFFPVGIFGPSPNSTDVPLDTAIVISFMRPVNIEDLELSPEAPIASQTTKQSLPASVEYTFCFAEPLEPATTYKVSVLSGGKPVTWNFTTTAEPYQPKFNTYLYPSVPLVAFAVAIIITFSVSLIMWHGKRKAAEALQIC